MPLSTLLLSSLHLLSVSIDFYPHYEYQFLVFLHAGNFLLDARHCIFSGDRYFSITKHNFEFFSGSWLKLLQIVGSFQILLLQFVRWSLSSV